MSSFVDFFLYFSRIFLPVGKLSDNGASAEKELKFANYRLFALVLFTYILRPDGLDYSPHPLLGYAPRRYNGRFLLW